MLTLNAISPAIRKMSVEERAMINIFLALGKDAGTQMKNMKPAALKKHWGMKRPVKAIAENLNTAFQEGVGFVDSFAGRDNDYGKQLDFTIRKVLVKSLKVSAPKFNNDADTKKGAIEREYWIVEQFLDRWWKDLPEKARIEILKTIVEEIKKQGFDPTMAAEVGTAMLTGGLTAARAIAGFQFFKVLAITAGYVSRLIVAPILGRGISFIGVQTFLKGAGIAFGPIGWVITIASLIPVITALIAPREYDKYIPVVFLVGLKRVTLEKNKILS